jgi:hypothetical protein
MFRTSKQKSPLGYWQLRLSREFGKIKTLKYLKTISHTTATYFRSRISILDKIKMAAETKEFKYTCTTRCNVQSLPTYRLVPKRITAGRTKHGNRNKKITTRNSTQETRGSNCGPCRINNRFYAAYKFKDILMY